MKLSSVENNNNRYIPAKANNKNSKKNVNFTGLDGALDVCVKFWQTVDHFGRAGQFTVEDMCGTNFPRSYKGLMAGKKYTGKYNWPAFFQEAIREFMTGPTMTFFPMIALAVSKSKFGPSANTKVVNTKNLSYLMTGIKGGTEEEVKKAFFSKVADDMLKSTLDSAADNKERMGSAKKELAGALSKCSDALDTLTDTKFFARKQPKENLKQAQKEVADLFSNIIKERKADFSDTNFKTVKFSIDNSSKGALDIGTYTDAITAYIHDFTKANKTNENLIDTSLNTIKTFSNKWISKRLFVMFWMIVVTGMLMRNIPRLYTKASGKINPNASGVYSEAEKRGKKSAQNEQPKNEGVTNDK